MRHFAIIFGLSFFLLGCGEDNPQTDEACKDVMCVVGVCSAGECVNPTSCNETDTCLNGFVCGDDNKCNIEITALCLDVECPAGECSKTTGECINKSVCDRNSPTDCIEGYSCYAQTCQTEATICSELDCSRGICDFKTASCANAPQCENDIECLSGSFCNEEKICQENKCDLNMDQCPRGECNPRNGLCENASVCSSIDDCTDGNYCIGTQCTPTDEACAMCEGNQVCTVNVNRVTCTESPQGCTNSLGCIGSRACNNGVCGDPVACTPDGNEPNADAATATSWKDTVVQSTIRGSICQGDSDYYLYNTRDSEHFTGTLVVSLNISPENVGNGTFTIDLLKNNTSVATQTSNDTGTVELRYPITAVDVGEFVIKISDSDLNLSGIEYDLFIHLVDAQTGEACENATPVVNGSASSDSSSSLSTSLKPSCAPAGVKRDSIFSLEVLEKAEMTFAVAPLDATISVRSSCEIDESEIECSTGGNELITTLEPGNYFVVVESLEADGPFALALTQKPFICTPGANRCIGTDDGETCNSAGTGYDAFTCDGDTCDMATGFCVRPPGDVCSDAIDATQGFDGTVNFSSLRNDYESNVCGTSFTTGGNDSTFSVVLPPNNRVDVLATHSSFNSLAVLIVDDCNTIDQTCLTHDVGSTSQTGYANMGTQDEHLFVVVDSSSSFSGSANVTIETSPIICVPNSKTCVGDDLDVCDSRGTTKALTACAYGCDATTNNCNPGLNDVCATAFDVSAGGSFNGFQADYANDYQPDASCISSARGAGSDSVWSVDAQAGQILNVSMTGDFDATLYVVSDCADIAGTCGAGSDRGQIETINYLIPSDGTYYIIADAFLTSGSGNFTLDVELTTPICTPGTTQCMGNNLDTCLPDGSGFDTQTCPGSCDGNVNQCSGNSCSSPIQIGAGQHIGDTDAFTNEYDPGSVSCTNHPAAGKDVVYQISGIPGDVVTTTLTSTYDASIYAVTDCDDLNSCIAGQDNGNPETINFIMPQTGSIFLVVDGFSSSSNGNYTLDVDIQTPDCFNPGQPVQCLNSATLQYCDSQGFLQNYQCNCSLSTCAQPTGDVCADVLTVFDQTVISSTYGDLTSTYNPSATSCPNATSNLDGPDAVYAIDLPPDSILTVDLDSSVFGRSMYITSDCTDVSNTCLWGAGTGSQDQIQYHTVQGGRHYVHIDTSTDTTTAAFTATFSVTNGVCQPGSSICNPNSNQTTTCSDDGSQIERIVDCISGCANINACGGPSIANDTCATSYDVVAPISFVEDLGRFTSDIDPGSASCFGRSTNGADLFYSVSLPANTVLDVSVDGSTTHTVAIVSDCAMPGTTCLAQEESYGDTKAVYASTGPEDVFVIIDHATTFSNELEVSIDFRPTECALGAETCLDASTREYCNESYELKTQPCTFGCTAGVCNAATNDLCGGAFDATAGGTFVEDISDYANDYEQPDAATSCTGFTTEGPDGVWSVNAVAGQVLTATMDPTGFDAALYISSDCTMIDSSCVAGSDTGTSAAETVSYTIPADGVYYIIADSYSLTPTGTFSLEITLL